MKYLLVLYMCSLGTGQCPSSSITGYQFDNHYDCIYYGYGVAQQTFKNLQTMEEFEREQIEEEKLTIKIECRQIGEKA